MFTITENQAAQLADAIRNATGDISDYVLFSVMVGASTCLGVVTTGRLNALTTSATFLEALGYKPAQPATWRSPLNEAQKVVIFTDVMVELSEA